MTKLSLAYLNEIASKVFPHLGETLTRQSFCKAALKTPFKSKYYRLFLITYKR